MVKPIPDGADDLPFSQLLTDCRTVLFRFAVSLTSLAEADDLVQDAMARAWSKRAQFDPLRGSVQSWLLAIVADQARLRRRRRFGGAPYARLPDSIEPGPSPVSVDLRHAIDALPARQRTAIVLRHYVDLSMTEIAAVMGCSVGTVKSTLHDAHHRLSVTLGVSYVRD